jgi:phosphocarrier protein HPr
MDNFINTIEKLFHLKGTPEVHEIDIDGATPMTAYFKKDFESHMTPKSAYPINAHYKFKRNSDGTYLFEGAIVYHEEKKDRIIYLKQEMQKSHIHGDFISKIDSEEDSSTNIHAQTFAELASKTEKLFLTDHPEHSENGYTHTLVDLTNKLGMHARPAALFVDLSTKYQSDIYVRNGKEASRGDIEIKGKKYVDGKSIIGLLTLGAEKDSQLEIIAQGEDSKQATDSLKSLVISKFGED